MGRLILLRGLRGTRLLWSWLLLELLVRNCLLQLLLRILLASSLSSSAASSSSSASTLPLVSALLLLLLLLEVRWLPIGRFNRAKLMSLLLVWFLGALATPRFP